MLALLSAILLLLTGCSTLPLDDRGTIALELSDQPQLPLPVNLPLVQEAMKLGSGADYLFYPGVSGGYPAFHLVIVDPGAGAWMAPLPEFPWGKKPEVALGASDGIAVVNGSPFRWAGIPYIGSREAAAVWQPGTLGQNEVGSMTGTAKKIGTGRISNTGNSTDDHREMAENALPGGLINYGYLSFDGTRYHVSPGLPEYSTWCIGGYLPFVQGGVNTGIHGERHARTAVGINPEGLLMVLVVEGYPPQSPGMTSRELAELLLFYGARDAINLDGGNSAALALRDPLNGKATTVYRGKRPRLPLFLVIHPGP